MNRFYEPFSLTHQTLHAFLEDEVEHVIKKASSKPWIFAQVKQSFGFQVVLMLKLSKGSTRNESMAKIIFYTDLSKAFSEVFVP